MHCDHECGMPRAARYLRRLADGHLLEASPAKNAWLLQQAAERAVPLQCTQNRHFNLLPDVAYWRLKVRFHHK